MKTGLSASEGYSIGLATKIEAISDIDFSKLRENTVLVAKKVPFYDEILLEKSAVVGIVTDIDNREVYSQIKRKKIGKPIVVGLGDITNIVNNGDKLIVDGVEGIVIVNPKEDVLVDYLQKKATFEENIKKDKRILNVKTRTKKGKRIQVLGNIEGPQDLKNVIECGGEGIGLFNTEYLNKGKGNMPSEDEQFTAYKYAATNLKGKPVVIRIHRDPENKESDFCSKQKEMFKIQLRALLRASVYGNLMIMYPGIEVPSEYLEAKEILKECMKELVKEGRDFNESVQTGIAVETPNAAINSVQIAKYADFISIGADELTKFTKGEVKIDQNKDLKVMDFVKMSIEAAHGEGKNCSVWGEIASDAAFIPILLKNGIDGFCVNAFSILKTKELIMNY